MKKNRNSLKLKKDIKLKKADPDKYLTKDFINADISECLEKNDSEGIVELVQTHKYIEKDKFDELLKQMLVEYDDVFRRLSKL